MFTAWGDESGSQATVDPGVYMLAAALCEHEREDAVRSAMTAARLRYEPKVHWHGRNAFDRRRIAELVGGLPIEMLVVVRSGPTSDSIERRRRKCLQAMIMELSDLGCADLVLESRGGADDRKDLVMLDTMRRSKMLQSGLHMAHAKGPTEAMLWVPDVVCGAMTQERVGDGSYRKLIETRLTVRVVEARS
jgi:hypothetical protein